MLLERVEYTKPASVAEAIEALSSRDGAAPLAGGQSLLNVLKNRVASVDLLVDISALEELRAIEVAHGALEIGACVTYDEIDRSPEIRASHPILSRVAGHIEDQQIRNRGTIGGNCCLSDPTNNLPPLIVALGATMNITGASGTRQVPADEFFHGYFMTAVAPGEILTSISIPALDASTGDGYNTLSVASDSKAIVRAAAEVRAQRNDRGRSGSARRGRPGAGPASRMEEALRGAAADAGRGPRGGGSDRRGHRADVRRPWQRRVPAQDGAGGGPPRRAGSDREREGTNE